MPIAADYPFLNILWSMIIFFIWVVWIWMMILILSDVFRRRDLSGWGKAGWMVFVIVLPFLGVLIYLIAQSDGMAQRRAEDAQGQRAQMDDYVRSVAGNGGAGRRDRQGQAAARQRRDHADGVRGHQGQGTGVGRRATRDWREARR